MAQCKFSQGLKLIVQDLFKKGVIISTNSLFTVQADLKLGKDEWQLTWIITANAT